MVPSTDTSEYSVPTDGLALPSSTWLTKLGETFTRRASSRSERPRCSRTARIAWPSCTGVVPAAVPVPVVAMGTSLSCAMGLYSSVHPIPAQRREFWTGCAVTLDTPVRGH